MKIFIRIDAYSDIGLGHAKRCSALAEGLQADVESITVLYHRMPDVMINEFESKGIACIDLGIETWSESADAEASKVILSEQPEPPLLIIDHYQLTIDWEKSLRPSVKGLIVIDDWGDRAHDCDLIIDQNLCESPDERYKGLLPDHCIRLIGHEYAMLGQDVLALKENRRPSDKALISFGGTYHAEVKKVLQAISDCQAEWQWQLVLGVISDKDYEEVMGLVSEHMDVHRYVDNMHDFLSEAALCIGASGSSNWERFYLGIPSIIVPLHDNQYQNAALIKKKGLAIVTELSHKTTVKTYMKIIQDLNISKLEHYAAHSSLLIDGGGVNRIRSEIARGLQA